MLDEAKAMIRVSKHDHIVNIQGDCYHKLHAKNCEIMCFYKYRTDYEW